MVAPVETLDALTAEFLPAKVAPTRAGVPIDPTSWPVYMALMARGTKPAVSDWVQGTWESYGGAHYALVKAGGDGIPLTAGQNRDWYIWIDGDTEQPVRYLGIVKVT